MKTEGTHQNDTSTLLPCACPHAWVVECSLVGIPPRCTFVFQSNVEELHQALSIIHLTCHHCNPPNPREAAGAGLQAETPEVWTVRTWMEGKPQQRERGWQVMSKDGYERKGVEGGWTTRKQRGDRWLLQREWQRWRAEEKMSKHWYSTQGGFFTLEGKPLTLNFPVHLTPSATVFVLSAMSRCGWEWKAKLDMSQTQREA